MIEYIKGELTEITPAMAVIECNGLGYGINVSLNTYSAIQGKKEVKLYIYESIREDAYIPGLQIGPTGRPTTLVVS